MEILLALTFVFGPLRLLTMLRPFKMELVVTTDLINFFRPLGQALTEDARENHWLGRLIAIMELLVEYIGALSYYFSLCFQAWWWLFKN